MSTGTEHRGEQGSEDPLLEIMTRLFGHEVALTGIGYREIRIDDEGFAGGEFIDTPRIFDFYVLAEDQHQEVPPVLFRAIMYRFNKDWQELRGEGYSVELKKATTTGLERLKALGQGGQVPVKSFFLGAGHGSPNYARLAMKGIVNFPKENGPITGTYLVVPGERDPELFDSLLKPIANLMARGVNVTIVKSLNDGLIDTIEGLSMKRGSKK